MQISIFVLSGLLVHPSRIPSVALPALAIAVVLDDTVPPCDAHHAQHVPHWDLCAGSRRGGNSQAVRRWFFMAIIVTMSETLPLANVKSRFSEMVDRVDRTHDRIIVTRNGRATAVLVSQGNSTLSRTPSICCLTRRRRLNLSNPGVRLSPAMS